MAELTVPRNGTTAALPDERIFLELGTTGLKQYGGMLQEERLPELQGQRGIRTYTQMGRDDIVGSLLFANETLLRQVAWMVQPADDTEHATTIAERIRGALFDDMSQSWPMLLSEILSVQKYGWAYHEICWKRCLGMDPPPGYDPMDPAWDWWASSRYADGLWMPRKLPIRAQETLVQWLFDRQGGVQGMVQMPPTGGGTLTIPISKALLFRIFSYKNNPEGRSLLYAAYESWYAKKHIRRMEGIGVEHDLAGVLVIRMPMRFKSAGASADEKAIAAYCEKMASSFHVNEQAGIVIFSDVDEHGNKKFDCELLQSSGQKQFDTNEIIQRYDTRILQSVMAQVLMLGMSRVGTEALAEAISELYTMGLLTILQSIAEVLNRHLFPKIMGYNGWPLEMRPTLVPGKVQQVDIEKLSKGLLNLTQAELIHPTPQDEAFLRAEFGLPAMAEEMTL